MTEHDERKSQPIDEGDTDLCRALWVSTALQAVVDARSESQKRSLKKAKADALEWLQASKEEESEFAVVCDLAGLDYRSTRSRLLEIVKSPEETADFRCIRKALQCNKGTELRSVYFKRMQRLETKRQLNRAKRLARQHLPESEPA